MKHLIAVLLGCLLLCGCAREVPAETTSPTTEAALSTTAPTGLYDPGSPLEAATGGAVRVYPLHYSDARGIRAFGGGILILSGEDTTTMTLLQGDTLLEAASRQLSFFLSAEDPSLVVWENTLSYFDPVSRETVVLDNELNVVSHIAAPADLQGVPVLSSDRSTLYYCTANALRAWDLESGIRRTIKEMAHPGQSVAGLHWGGTIVHCSTEESNLFLDANSGQLVQAWEEDISLVSTDSTFCAALELGLNPVLIFGSSSYPQILLPEHFTGSYFCLRNTLGAVRISTPSDNTVSLEYYDLTQGQRTSILSLEAQMLPTAAEAAADGFVYILTRDVAAGRDKVLRWNIDALPCKDGGEGAGGYAMEDSPLAAVYAQCSLYAEEIGQQYGIEILIGDAAAAVEPWDYDLEPETQPALILRELMLLWQRLEQYPRGMLQATASNFGSLKLCLVRSVTGSAESGSVSAATGVQFFDGTDAYVAITVGKYGEQALYHELFHAMETHIFNNSIAFDQWDALNPSGFSYDYGYAANETRDSGIYLLPEHRSFIDTYSMSFPKEDRARIMEYAMLAGNEALFQAPALQAKLQALCDGIREAYGLETAEETFPWEQYLD